MRSAALASSAAVLAALGACGGGADADPSAARIGGLRASVVERADAGGSWGARWRVCWTPVRRARGYAVSIVTSEGTGRSTRPVAGSCWSLTVATGVPRRRDLARQVALIAPALSVRVAAVLPGGRRGPRSPAIAVGAAYP